MNILAEDSPYGKLWGCRDKRGGYTGVNYLGAPSCASATSSAPSSDHAIRRAKNNA